MPRRRGLSVRLKLTLSYAGFLMIAGALLLAVVWVFLLRYVPDNSQGLLWTSPNRYLLVRTFAPAAAAALAFLLVFGLLGGWILAGRMLAPLDRIADAARRAADGSLSHRIRLEGREFRELADGFDTMLERPESHVAEQRRFAANASHELRTPLAVAKSLLDVTGGAALTSSSAEPLLRMVTNLVQNAIVHNLPDGGTVTVHTEAHGDTSVLRVENTGRRLPPALVPTLTEPFRRGTDRVRTDEHAGVGLGLAIVHSIVRAHDGPLVLVPRPAGGLLVTVRLPGTP